MFHHEKPDLGLYIISIQLHIQFQPLNTIYIEAYAPNHTMELLQVSKYPAATRLLVKDMAETLETEQK